MDMTRDEPTVRVSKVVPIDEAPHVFAKGFLVRLGDASTATLDLVRKALQERPGPLTVALEFHPDARSRVIVKAAGSWSVAADPGLVARLREVPGVRAAEFLAREP